ncbi:glycosyltransferase [Sphingobacterium paramultivorum]|uniref:Glycosyltransferase n=1 Tax=Sphingobacterium paramultivorum TaxID=2886510 RepID=A0A7G5E701_9SPHI|nr:glycosyltransferase [Sphingobacterium paramultivorum]QMV69776.1 glycosyltransferase [Sphingobacterium paramultivorum]WSO13601.1 glycosyltransferase [Sphingobacterium paramultivorum]
MKILHVINSLDMGGAERLVVESIPFYQRHGLDVDLLVLKKTNSSFYQKFERKALGKFIALTKGSVYNPVLIFKIIPILKKYDIIHTHLFPALYWVVLARIFSRRRCKVVYTEHSTYNRRRDIFGLRYFDKWIYSFLNYIGCISEATYENLTNYLHSKSADIGVIYNGINLEEFTATNSISKFDFFDKNSFVLIQVSSFREQKDQQTLMRSLSLLPDDIKLLLVGDGTLRSFHEELAKELHIENKVKFLGNRSDVSDLLKYADVCILSSNHEGFGLAILEGMACGKPCIASDIPGLSEIVKGFGLVFKNGDYKALADLVIKLKEEAFYNMIAQRCLDRAKDFSIENMVSKYITIYHSLNEK